jgi:hypothetical protein
LLLVVGFLGQRVLGTVKDIEHFQQEIAIAIGYLPVEFSTEVTRRTGLGVIFDYTKYCSEHNRVLIVVQFHEGTFHQGSPTLLIDSYTRFPSGGFSEAEQQAIDNLTLGYCVKHQGLLFPDRMRRYRTPFVNKTHDVATRIHAALRSNNWSISR